jgi:CheY-like chemotaxis protein/signal transduction histidine kinase
MKEADNSKSGFPKIPLAAVAVVLFFCGLQVVSLLKNRGDMPLNGPFALTGLIMVLLIIAFMYKYVANTALLSFFVSITLFLFYLLLADLSNGIPYFFTVYFCITQICCLYYRPVPLLFFLVCSNLLIAFCITHNVPIIGRYFSWNIPIMNWGASIAVSLFAFILTQAIRNKIKEYQRAESYFKMFSANTPDYTAMLDGENRILFIGGKMAQAFHIKYPELSVGIPLIDLIDNKDLHSLLSLMLNRKRAYESIWKIHSSQGDIYYHIIYKNFTGVVTRNFLYLIDVTAIMRSKRFAEENMRMKNTFLANTSHEIRTPLNAILGMVELILHHDVSADVYENALHIKNAGKNLLAFVNDIIDYSKIESGKFELIFADYRMDALINDIISITKMRLSEKPALFLVNADGALPTAFSGDIARVRQILLTMLSNAAQRASHGVISIAINGEYTDDTHIRFSVQVAGGEKSGLLNISSDFVSDYQSGDKNYEKYGFDLAVSRNICKLMQGEMAVCAESSKGVVFSASFIQKVIDKTPFAIVESPETKSVLLYEKDPIYAESISRSLQNLGVICDIALNADEFVRVLQKKTSCFVFINNDLFRESETVLREYAPDITPAVLAENRDSISYSIPVIPAPAYALSLANVLNSGFEQNGFPHLLEDKGEKREKNTVFTAESALVLVVDDVATNIKVAEGLLRHYKIKADAAFSGEDALELIDRIPYDLVFMDYMMPVMDGIETLRVIRAQERKNMPVVVLTANAVVGMKELFMKEGFNDYLSKPIDVSKLDEILRKWIPKEKQQSAQLLETGIEKDKENLEIEGVSVETGMRMAGGSKEAYLDILATYIKDAEERLSWFNSFDFQDFKLFTTQVHALKGASASIGAQKLAEHALKLEKAGRDYAVETITQELDIFREELALQIERIRAVLPSQPEIIENEETDAISPEDIADFLRLKAALESEDIGAVDNILTICMKKSLSALMKKNLARIDEHILLSEFKEALAILEEMHI